MAFRSPSRFAALLENVGNAFSDAVWPPACATCGGAVESGVLCSLCLRELEQAAMCDRCGAPLSFDDSGCSRCSELPAEIDRCVAAAPYAPVRRAIHAFKYHADLDAGRALGEMLARAVRSQVSEIGVALVVPVPLHPRRFRARGFNQAQVLAVGVAKATSIPIGEALVRTRYTGSQTRLAFEEHRRRNVAGAFRPSDLLQLAGERVLVVDDVITTGATTGACARALLAAGASSVCAAAVARPGISD